MNLIQREVGNVPNLGKRRRLLFVIAIRNSRDWDRASYSDKETKRWRKDGRERDRDREREGEVRWGELLSLVAVAPISFIPRGSVHLKRYHKNQPSENALRRAWKPITTSTATTTTKKKEEIIARNKCSSSYTNLLPNDTLRSRAVWPDRAIGDKILVKSKTNSLVFLVIIKDSTF